MNILYGVSGVGYGHSSRAELIADHLQKKGHKIKIMTYSDGYSALKDRFDCIKIEGLEIVFENGKVKKRKTIRKNTKIIAKNLGVKKYANLIKSFKPDLCISDMESTVNRISKKFKIPLISLDNQHAITNLKIKVPIKYLKDYFISKGVIKGLVRKPKVFIVSSFCDAPLKKKNTLLVPPIIRKEVQKLKKEKSSGKILVYISRGEKESLEKLKEIKEKFVVFGFNENRKEQNLEFKTKDKFLKELEKCKCIIATAGFSLISEALYLKKPFFALPLKGQFEQVFNAILIKKAGYGDFSEKIEIEKISYFLKNLKKYKKNLNEQKFDHNKIFEVIDKEIEKIKTNS